MRLLVVTLCCFGLLVVTLCCFVAPPIIRADPTEDAVIKAIKQLGGRVDQDGKVVNLSSTKVTDAELKELAALKNLTTLDLSDTTVTGAGKKELAALQNLRILSLCDIEILADEELKQLANIKNLTYLDLNFSKISDTRLMELSAIPGLAHLHVTLTNLSEAGKKAFKQRNPKCELSGPTSTWRDAIKR
jgi:internalin A